jgi:thioredoxin
MANKNAKNKTNKKNNTNNKKVNSNQKNTNKKVTSNNNVKKENIKKENIKVEEIAKEVKVEEKKEVKAKEKKSFSLTSKQKDIILILLVVVLLIVACIVTSTKKESKVNIELPVAVEGEAGTKTISYTEYEELMNSNKPFLMVIIQDGCGYCEMYEPVVEEVANELGIPVNYLNLTNLSSEESNKLSKSNSYLKKNQWGTPTTLFMVGDKVIDSIGQYVEKDDFVSFVKENIKVDVNE